MIVDKRLGSQWWCKDAPKTEVGIRADSRRSRPLVGTRDRAQFDAPVVGLQGLHQFGPMRQQTVLQVDAGQPRHRSRRQPGEQGGRLAAQLPARRRRFGARGRVMAGLRDNVVSPAATANDGLRLRVLSLGAGVQSTTLALMAARGEIGPMPDCAI